MPSCKINVLPQAMQRSGAWPTGHLGVWWGDRTENPILNIGQSELLT